VYGWSEEMSSGVGTLLRCHEVSEGVQKLRSCFIGFGIGLGLYTGD
jgi:hypothetical protein